MNRDFRFKVLYPIIGGITGIIFVWLLSAFDIFVQIENFLLDMKYAVSARDTRETQLKQGVTQIERDLESDILILGIDEKSVGLTELLGKFPWPRSVYGEIINYFDVDQQLIEDYDEAIQETDEILSNLRDERRVANENWKNQPFDFIATLNEQALEYAQEFDISLYDDLHSVNLRVISRLSDNPPNKEILDEITIINEFVLSVLEPKEEDKLEYYNSIIEWTNNLKLYINSIIENTQNQLLEIEDEESDEAKNIQNQLNTLQNEQTLLLNLDRIIEKYITFLNPTENYSIETLTTEIINYLNNELGISDIELSDDNISQKQLVSEYIRMIFENQAKTLDKINNDAISFYNTSINENIEEENNIEDIQNKLNNLQVSNINVINILFRNQSNVEILSNTERLTAYILENLNPLGRNYDRFKYYEGIIDLSDLLKKYINSTNKDDDTLNILTEFEENAEVLRYYYKKRYERDDILVWNMDDVRSLLDYNNGDIEPNALFFDIFIDQPGETKIYELSSKKSFYNILKNDINQENGLSEYTYDDFAGTIEDVRGISDERLFEELNQQKEEGGNFVFWDYFGQFVDEGRLSISETESRLNAMEPYRITDNITNPEVGENNMVTYRDLKPPLVPVIRNSGGIGAAMVEPDYDGTLRKMPLLIRYYDERVNPARRDEPLMKRPEYYAAINMVLAMNYYKVKKEDVVITLGDKAVLKNATIPKKVKITHEYFDDVFFRNTQREYYFNDEDLRYYFENQLQFPEFTTVSIIHYEEQKLIEDGETTLKNIMDNINNPKEPLTQFSYKQDNEAITINNINEKYIVSEYGLLKFNASHLGEQIKILLGDENLSNVNVKFSHWEDADNYDNNSQNHANRILVEDGATTLDQLIEESTGRVFAARGITFEDANKGKIQIYDFDNTIVEIPKTNDKVLQMTANELVSFLISTVTFRKIEKEKPINENDQTDESNKKEDEFNPVIIPFYELLLDGEFNRITYMDSNDTIQTISNLEEYDVTIQQDNTERFRFSADKFTKVYYQETEIQNVKIPIDEEGKFIINFQGNPGITFETLPIYQLYSEITSDRGDPGRANWDTYKNRVLLGGIYSSAGINTEGRKDTFQTPYGIMFGIEVHANSLYTIFNRDFIESIPEWADWLIRIGILILLILILPRISILKGAIIGVFLILLVFIEGLTIFALFKYNIPIFPQLITAFYGFIALTVVKLLSEEREKRQIRGVFSTYVNAEVVNELLKDPEHALQLGGASKIITCFFSDIRGFTSLSEELKKVSDTELVNRMNEYFSVMTDIILKYKGTLDKYMGDAIMAFWGAPIEYDKHGLLACKTALEMIEQLPKLKSQWPENLRNFDIGIGINTGPAVAGNTGSELRKNYTILGDTVNLGSRLEGVNKTYKTRIIISEYTKKEVEDFVIVRELDLIRVKGKTEPVRIYELLGLNEAGENYQIGDVRININN